MSRQKLDPWLEAAQPWALEAVKPLCARCRRPVRVLEMRQDPFLEMNIYRAECCNTSQEMHVPWAAYKDPAFALLPGELSIDTP